MDNVYCIGCKRSVLKQDAKMVMKTGFYKSVPLGVCKCCSERVLEGSPEITDSSLSTDKLRQASVPC